MIPLYKPFMPEHLPELDSVLKSGALSYGKWGKLFENKLSQFVGNENSIVVNSYNSAMLIALLVIDTKPGDEVIASPMSCLASNQPFATQRIKIVWADIDPKTGTLDPVSVKSKITSKTKAIFHNHFCGYPGLIDEINLLGKENGIFVVDDAIEAFGTEHNGLRMGNFNSDITIFSFQTVRFPNTIDGGALTFSSKELLEKGILARDYGIKRAKFRDEIGEINPSCDIASPGYGATLSDVNSYIGTVQMDYIDDIIAAHRKNASTWIKKIQDEYPDIEYMRHTKNSVPNYWVFGVLAKNKRETISLFRNAGFYASSVHLNNNIYSVFKDQTNLPGVADFFNKFVALPCGWWL